MNLLSTNEVLKVMFSTPDLQETDFYVLFIE